MSDPVNEAIARVSERSRRVRNVTSTAPLGISRAHTVIGIDEEDKYFVPATRLNTGRNSKVASLGRPKSLNHSLNEDILVAALMEFSLQEISSTDGDCDHRPNSSMHQRLQHVVRECKPTKRRSSQRTLDYTSTFSTASLTDPSSSILEETSGHEEDDVPLTPPSTKKRSVTNTVVPVAAAVSYEEVPNSTSLARLSRHVMVNNRGPVKIPVTTNRVLVHVYDLIHRETVLETAWCDFPIGECFNTINDGMHCLGTGAYHAGIEINGIEYAYGSNQVDGQSGVFTCIPQQSPGYQYRTTLDLGEVKTTRRQWILVPVMVPHEDEQQSNSSSADESDDVKSVRAMSEIYTSPTLGRYVHPEHRSNSMPINGHHHSPEVSTQVSPSPEHNKKAKLMYQYREVKSFVEGKMIIREMAQEYMGVDYDLLRKNCCTFVKDACLRLGVEEEKIPSWFWVSSTVVSFCSSFLFHEHSFSDVLTRILQRVFFYS